LNPPSFDSDIFFTDELFDSTLKHLARLGEIGKIPIEVRSRIEVKIGRPLPGDLIHENAPKFAKIIRIDPAYFLEYVLQLEEYRAHRFLPLLGLLRTIQFNLGSLVALVRRFSPGYATWTSVRKRAVWLRFLSSCLICAQAQHRRFPSETNELIATISAYFSDFSAVVFSASYIEISTLIRCLLKVARGNTACGLFLASISPGAGTFSLFVVQAIQLRRSVKESDIRDLLKSDRPAEISAALKSMLWLMESGRASFVQGLVPLFVKALPSYSICFKCAAVAVDLFSSLLGSELGRSLDSEVYIRYIDSFLKPVNAPTFSLPVAVVSRLVRRLFSVLSILMAAEFTNFELVCAINSAYQARLADLDSRQAELFRVDSIEMFLPYFKKFTTIETARLLYGLCGCSIDIPIFFFGKLPKVAASFLPLFPFLRREFKMWTVAIVLPLPNVLLLLLRVKPLCKCGLFFRLLELAPASPPPRI
jgi:hypothetical protein